jgi:hypothetical protein
MPQKQPKITDLRPLLTEQELVARWRGKVSPTTLATWRSRRVGPGYIKVGRSVLYPQCYVEKYEDGKSIR